MPIRIGAIWILIVTNTPKTLVYFMSINNSLNNFLAACCAFLTAVGEHNSPVGLRQARLYIFAIICCAIHELRKMKSYLNNLRGDRLRKLFADQKTFYLLYR